MNMEKYSPRVRSEGAGGMLCKANASANMELLQSCIGGDDGSMGNNGGNMGTRPVRPSGDDSGFSGAPQPLSRTILLGAVAIICGLVLLPSRAVASSSTQGSSRVASHSVPSNTRRTLCLNNTAATVVTAVPDNAIVYGQVQLSEGERRLMCGRQLHFRETLRSEALSC